MAGLLRSGGRRRKVVSGAVVGVTLTATVVALVTADGFSAADVSLNDAGVWVTRGAMLELGRFNRQVDQLDASASTSLDHGVDVLQSGSSVVLVDSAQSRFAVVDPAYVGVSSPVSAPKGSLVGLGGGVSALLDPAQGRLWVRPGVGVAAVKPAKDAPDLTVDKDAVLAVGEDGAVHVLSAATGQLTTVRGAGRDVKAERHTVKGAKGAKGLKLSAVGPSPVAVDADGHVLLADHDPVDVSGEGGSAVVQQAGPAAADVLVATDQALLAVPLDGGGARRLATGAGTPSAPVMLGGCVHGLWSGASPSMVRGCAGASPQAYPVKGANAQARLVFRVNRGQIVINDVEGGGVWRLEDLQRVDNWDEVQQRPEPEVTDESRTEDEQPDRRRDQRGPNRPPVAVDDAFGARPGQPVALPVLDNDTDPDGDILALASLPTIAKGKLDLIENGRTLQYTPEAGASGTVRFSYTVDDGRGGTDSAAVTVAIHGADVNGPPRLRKGRVQSPSVQTGRSLKYVVLADWEDPDGDPLALVGASVAAPDSVRFTGSGLVTYLDAGAAQVTKPVSYLVSDGRGEPVAGRMTVKVQPAINKPPSARDDLYTARAGQTVTLQPLLNDIDVNDDPLHLAPLAPVPGAAAVPDFTANTIKFRAGRPGSYVFPYVVTDGPTKSEGLVRVDVRAASGNSAPVGVADTLAVPEGSSALSDVLANDLDLDGDVLVVRGIQVPQGAGVRVSVSDLRYLRVEADRALTSPVVIGYEVSDGLASAQGRLTVRTVSASPTNQPPLVKDDTAVVRAGDLLTVPVLANDSDPDGDKLTLSTSITGVSGAKGLLFADGDVVRFQAPSTPGSVSAVYTVVDERGARASGQLTVTVRAVDKRRNDPPSAPTVEARGFAGSRIRIPVPLVGRDPDGDSVTLLGAATAPQLGRLVGIEDGTTLIYEAFADSAGTDSFSYSIVDALGASARGLVRVGLARRPEGDQPPVAVDDLLRVKPGRDVAVAVLANDNDPDGDPIGFDERSPFTAPESLRPQLLGDRIGLSLPTEPTTVNIPYAITDGRGGRDTAFLTVQSDPAAPALAPVARDDVLTDTSTARDVGGAKVVDVDVRANDDDPDGRREDLKVAAVGPQAAAATVTPQGHLLIALKPGPQVIGYTVTDVDKLSATAFVMVPGLDGQRPRLKSATPLKVRGGTATTIRLGDVVVDPEGGKVRLTSEDAVSASRSDGSALVVNATTLRFAAAQGYAGPASLTFEVTTGTSPEDPKGRKAVLTLPIEVLPPSNRPPVPTPATVDVAPGETAISVDLREFVRDPDPADAAKLTFGRPSGAASWLDASVSGSTLSLATPTQTPKGSRSVIAVAVSDGTNPAVALKVTVRVTASTRPLAKANDDDVAKADAGKAVRIDVLANDANPFPGTKLTLRNVRQVAGSGSVVRDGDTVVYTPAASFVGTARLVYDVLDATNDPGRVVTGRVAVTVRGKPAKPLTAPTVVDSGDGFVALRLSPAGDNGAPVTGYEIDGTPGYEGTCATDVCRVTGLDNGTEYRFRFRAVNEVGEGEWSDPSEAVTPDVVPDAPAAPVAAFVTGTAEGGAVKVSWSVPANEGSPIQRYVVTMSPPGSNGSTVESQTTDATIAGLTNGTPYTFTVRAVNAKGDGPDSAPSAPETPAGLPGRPSAPTARNSGGAVGKQITVSWAEPPSNGAAISSYTLRVFRDGAQVATLNPTTNEAVISADNARAYTFDVSATNKAGTSPVSGRSAAVTAFGAPFAVSSVSATAGDRQIAVDFAAPNDNGKAISRYEYRLGASGAWTGLPGNKVVSGLTNGRSYSVQVRACNDYCGGAGTAAAQVPFGLLEAPSVDVSMPTGHNVQVNWSPPADNGRGVDHIEYSVNGGGWQRGGLTDAWVSPNKYNTGYDVSVRAVDTAGNAGAARSVHQDTERSFLEVDRGALKRVNGVCTDSTCGYVRVRIYNFDEGDHAFQIHASYDDFGRNGPITIRAGSDGRGYYEGPKIYGYGGKQVWVTHNATGISSNVYTWPMP
ncbi:MAG: Ig-like domain-containing protein [Kineosporiaceae bacterium]